MKNKTVHAMVVFVVQHKNTFDILGITTHKSLAEELILEYKRHKRRLGNEFEFEFNIIEAVIYLPKDFDIVRKIRNWKAHKTLKPSFCGSIPFLNEIKALARNQ